MINEWGDGVKNHAVARVRTIKKNLKENLKDSDSHGKDSVACTRILTPIYQPPHAAKLKASLYKDETGCYLLEYFGEKHLSSCSDDGDHNKVTAAWVAAWATELTALSKFTFRAIKAIQASEESLSFNAASSKLMVMARTKMRLAHGKKMTKISLRLPKKSSPSNQS